MIIVVKNTCEKNQFDNLVDWIKELGLDVHVSRGTHSTVLGLVGSTEKVDIDLISSLDIVEQVQRVQEPYKNANRKFHPENTIVDVNGVKFGGDNFQLIAGPCSVESEAQIIEIATNENEIVMDAFLGSGTTVSAAHKLGRNYIGIEREVQTCEYIIKRMDQVVAGERGGISKKVNWQGGGDYQFVCLK